MLKAACLVFGAFLNILFSLSLSAEPSTPEKLSPLRVIEDFSNAPAGKFPESFRTYPFQRGKALEVYTVGEEGGNRFLKGAEKNDNSVQVFKRFRWDRIRYPYASWKWRAKALPAGGNENNGRPNDSACGIYIVFGGYTGKALKYVWSSTLPAGTVVTKKPGKFYILVKESGPRKLNIWRTVNVNVVEDFKRLFHADPGKDPNGFGILTDGNATHTPSSCDYDDFMIAEKE